MARKDLQKKIGASKEDDEPCTNCGEQDHTAKACFQRPRKVGAKYSKKFIAPRENILNQPKVNYDTEKNRPKVTYDAKRDRWADYNAVTNYRRVRDCFEAREDARCSYLEKELLKRLEDGNDVAEPVSTTTVRSNPRIRQDTAKYLFNLDVNSAYYNPKTRSMHEDPLPNVDPDEKVYFGDDHYNGQPETQKLKMVLENYGNAVSEIPPMELSRQNCTVVAKEKQSQKLKMLLEKYGNAASEIPPMELLIGQPERQTLNKISATEENSTVAKEKVSQKYGNASSIDEEVLTGQPEKQILNNILTTEDLDLDDEKTRR